MTEITLTKFLIDRTQKEAAEELGVNQSAISQMLAANRDIRILLSDSGSVMDSYEHRKIGCKSAQVA